MIKAMQDTFSQIKVYNMYKDLAICILASILIGLFAPCKVYLPFSPIPLALQSTVVVFLSFYLGAKKGAIAAVFFILQGLMHFPVFAGCGFGVSHLLGPTGGYIIGYVLAAVLVGSYANKCESSKKLYLLILASHYVVFIPGVVYLAGYVGYTNAFVLGALPFFLGDAVKAMIVTKIILSLKLSQRDLENCL